MGFVLIIGFTAHLQTRQYTPETLQDTLGPLNLLHCLMSVT
jgi:hypothetical protein